VGVALFGRIREVLGRREVEVEVDLEKARVRNILCKIVEINRKAESIIFTKSMRLRDDIKILVNGRPIELLSSLDTSLEEGAELCIFTAVGGG